MNDMYKQRYTSRVNELMRLPAISNSAALHDRDCSYALRGIDIRPYHTI